MSSAVVLATAGYDHKIRFWEASREKCQRTLSFRESQVNALAITNDKQYIAAVGNPHAKIFEVQRDNNDAVITYDAHAGNVTAVGFQCDAKWMYTGSEDKMIRIWDLRAPRWQRQYECQAPVNCVALHPNQTELISGDQNGNVRVWDLQANACMQEIVPDGDVPIRSVAVASDSSLVVAGNNTGKVFAWHPSTSADYTAKALTETGHDGYLLKCVISPDCRRLVTCSSDQTVKIWNLGGGDDALEGDDSGPVGFKEESTLTAHQRWVWDACFSADSAYLVTASSDMTAKLWDVDAGAVIRHYTGQMAMTCVALNDSSS